MMAMLALTTLTLLASPSAETASAAVLVDLNTADVSVLCTLPGIGPKKAEAIVALRQRRPLTRLTQLLQVRGIGPRLLERLKGRITLRPSLATVVRDDRKNRASGHQHAALVLHGATLEP
jgi:competence ComEA-like helix-hairpin-helix protein